LELAFPQTLEFPPWSRGQSKLICISCFTSHRSLLHMTLPILLPAPAGAWIVAPSRSTRTRQAHRSVFGSWRT
jgi:hypothetical protein